MSKIIHFAGAVQSVICRNKAPRGAHKTGIASLVTCKTCLKILGADAAKRAKLAGDAVEQHAKAMQPFLAVVTDYNLKLGTVVVTDDVGDVALMLSDFTTPERVGLGREVVVTPKDPLHYSARVLRLLDPVDVASRTPIAAIVEAAGSAGADVAKGYAKHASTCPHCGQMAEALKALVDVLTDGEWGTHAHGVAGDKARAALANRE